ncbi:hypothetical protein [Sphingomicrobium marinum]|uniref:hypothetical protein n=1 Tax=Sphingomicrobium marinum TaxID=1227950 RepID=UPI00224081FF|nr:hypothetical protein [Sphingomicrobium marinum]
MIDSDEFAELKRRVRRLELYSQEHADQLIEALDEREDDKRRARWGYLDLLMLGVSLVASFYVSENVLGLEGLLHFLVGFVGFFLIFGFHLKITEKDRERQGKAQRSLPIWKYRND